MPENLYPTTIAGFTEYIKIAYKKAETNLQVYGIPPERLAVITPLYNTYVQAEALAADPETATRGARRTRDEARDVLEPAWRQFLNTNIRYNPAVSAADLEVFRIRKRDSTRTPAGIPDAIPLVSVKNVGVRRFEAEVLDSATGKKKKPHNAAGSYVYVAVTEAGQEPQHEDEYRKLDFSSNCHHTLEFPFDQLAKQAHIYSRYANVHGKEGPKGPVETVIIG
jgi:hypothetical protein